MVLIRRSFSFLAGLVLLAVGILGFVLPVLPGTIFLILAAGCFAHSSPPFERWLLNHTHLGPPVTRWRKHGAMSVQAKRVALGMMALVALFTVVRYGMSFPYVTGTSLFLLSFSAFYIALLPEEEE